MSNPNDWSHFYNNHHQTFSSSTAAADAPNPIQFMGSRTSSSSLNPEGGRVSKPARKRSRASRRTPTTLLNTDTSNFRAMVQQFTGGPAGPFMTAGRGSSSLNVPGFSYGLLNPAVQGRQQLSHQLIGNQISNAVMSTTAGGGDGGSGGGGGFHNLQYQQQFQSPSQFMFSLGNNSISDGPNTNASSDAHLLLQPGIVNERSGEASAGTQIVGAPPQQETTSGSNENRGSGFLY
ncbi:VQ motif-containing protein 22 [Linum perenne]